MVKRTSRARSNKATFKGRGLVNRIIDRLPFELHLPNYDFCGPGTKLDLRLARGDQGKNKLDRLCREHDISYAESLKNSSTYDKARREADLKLEHGAWDRVKSSDANFGEKAAAWLVTTGMKAKRKLSGGGGKVKKTNKRKLHSVKGGVLPLILAGLGALGSIVGGVSTLAKNVSDTKKLSKRMEEERRHNLAMESKGRGLYLKPYKFNGAGGGGRVRARQTKNKQKKRKISNNKRK